MSDYTKRTTVYLEPSLHQALRLKSAETEQSISALINESLRLTLLEDAEDLLAFKERANEPIISYESLLEELKADGTI